MGKHSTGHLTETQKYDLCLWIRMRDRMNSSACKSEVLGMIVRFMFLREGRLVEEQMHDFQPGDADLQRAKFTYWHWRQWANKNMPADLRLLTATGTRAKATRSQEAEALTPAGVKATQDRFRRHLVDRQIMDADTNEILRPECLWCCDEKGYNDERLAGVRAVRSASSGHAASSISRMQKHVSVLSFVAADGASAPPAVVLAGQSFHPRWTELWPNAAFDFSPKGSFSNTTFVQAVAECLVPVVRGSGSEIDANQYIALALDSGGGTSGMHLSLPFALLCHKHRIEPLVLDAYTTKAFMALDREPHRQAEIRWGLGRQRFAATHGHAVHNLWQALPLIHAAYTSSVQPHIIKAGWRDTGLCPWAPEKLLVQQAGTLFRCSRVDSQPAFLDAASSKILALPPASRKERVECSSCHAFVPTSYRFCLHCSAANVHANELAILSQGPPTRGGYKRSHPPRFDPSLLMDEFEASLAPVSVDPYEEPISSQEMPDAMLAEALALAAPPAEALDKSAEALPIADKDEKKQ
jgi:hypothetical protein